MTPEVDEESKNYFNIEAFFRARSSHTAVLKLDEIILRADIGAEEKFELVNKLIAETLEKA